MIFSSNSSAWCADQVSKDDSFVSPLLLLFSLGWCQLGGQVFLLLEGAIICTPIARGSGWAPSKVRGEEKGVEWQQWEDSPPLANIHRVTLLGAKCWDQVFIKGRVVPQLLFTLGSISRSSAQDPSNCTIMRKSSLWSVWENHRIHSLIVIRFPNPLRNKFLKNRSWSSQASGRAHFQVFTQKEN